VWYEGIFYLEILPGLVKNLPETEKYTIKVPWDSIMSMIKKVKLSLRLIN
jgi:hypothetical protein